MMLRESRIQGEAFQMEKGALALRRKSKTNICNR